jgi:hypothetical protein
MHFTCRSFIGTPTDLSWSQFWENEPDDLNQIQNYGHLFGLASLTLAAPSSQIASLGKDLINEINQVYFSSVETDPQFRLRHTLTSILQNPLFNFSQLNLLIAIVLNHRLYLAGSGLVHASLFRSSQFSTLINPGSSEVVVISGPILPEDKIVFCTQDYFQNLGWENIKSAISLPKIQSIEEDLLSRLYALPDPQTSASALIQIHQENLEEPEISSPPLISAVSPSPSPPSPSPIIPSPPKPSIFAKLLKPRPVFVSTHDTTQISRRKKLHLGLAFVLLSLFGVSLYLGYQKNQQIKTENQYQQLKTQLDKNISDAYAIRNLNIDSANQLATQSQQLLSQLKALQVHIAELASYDQTLAQLLSQTGASTGFTPDLFFDTSIIVNQPNYTALQFSDGNLYLVDFASGRIDRVSTIQKSTTNLLNQTNLSGFTASALYNNDLYLFGDSAIALVKNKVIEEKIDLSQESSSPHPVSLSSWTSSFYLLDQKNRTILKFSPSGSEFSSAQSWLKDGQTIPSDPVSLAINGKIWVLLSDGQIIPYVRGVKDNFKPLQAPTITSASDLVVGVDNETLAFVDDHQFVYVYKKSGEVVSKYNFGQLKISSIAYNEKDNLIYVLCQDQKIYQIKLE